MTDGPLDLRSVVDLLGRFDAAVPLRLWAASFAIGVLLELVLPRAEARHAVGSYGRALIHAAIYLIVIFIVAPTVYAGTAWVRQSMGLHPLIHVNFIDTSTVWGQIAVGLLGLFIADFCIYWWHRAQHTLPVLWDQHVVHHAPTELNVVTGIRHHWTEFIFQAFTVALPMSLFVDITPTGMGVVASILGAWSHLNHANLRIGLGQLSWLATTPQLHRLHHSLLPQHVNKNYAAYFPVFDIIFGTYVAPKAGEYPPTGVKNVRIDSVAAMSTYPFVKWFERLVSLGQLPKRSIRTAWLDGLRGLAAIVALLGHCSNFGLHVIPGLDLTGVAKSGVWIFFALSAYLLTERLADDLAQPGQRWSALVLYATKRVLRVMPAYLVVLAALALAGVLSPYTALMNAALIEGWEHFWSIPTEMAFYCVLPVVVLAFVFVPRRHHRALATGLLLASAALYCELPSPRIAGNPLGLSHYLYFFFLGVSVMIFGRDIKISNRTATLAGTVFLTLAIAVHPRLITYFTNLPLAATMDFYPLSASSFAVFMFCSVNSTTLKQLLAWAPFRFYGMISFSLYLTHYVLVMHIAQWSFLASALKPTVAIGLSTLVGFVCYLIIERPVMKRASHLRFSSDFSEIKSKIKVRCRELLKPCPTETNGNNTHKVKNSGYEHESPLTEEPTLL